MKIAIIGAGFAGLSASIGLHGHDITLYEQALELKPVGAGLLIQPFGLSVLRRMGLDEGVIQAGDRIERLIGKTLASHTILNLQYNKYEQDFFGVGIHRGSLFRLLYHKAMNSHPKLVLQAHVCDLRDVHTQPKVVLTDGSVSDPYDLVIVSNGARSSLRALLPGKKFEQEYPWGALWGVFENTGLDTSTLFQRYGGTTRLLGFLPCGDHPKTGKRSVSFFWSLRKTDHQALVAAGLDVFKDTLCTFEPDCQYLLSQMTSWEHFSFVSYTDVYLREWMEGKVLFIGDSAHGMSPQLGLGANMAIYDGLLTGELLATGGLDGLRELATLRRKQNLFYHRLSRLMTPLFQSDHRLLGPLRNSTFPLLPHIPFIDRLMVETLYGTRDGLFSRRGLV